MAETTLPKPGKVTQVCRQFGVLEDHALAYRLQNEEITYHYDHNRSRNAILREDVPTAKEIQKKEEAELQRRVERYRLKLYQQEAADSRVAQELQHRITKHEDDKKRVVLLKDKQIAQTIQDRHELRRPVVKEHWTPTHEAPPPPPPKPSRNSRNCADLPDDFLRVNGHESPKKVQEQKDEEIARRLQEEESCSTAEGVDRDKMLAIEAQDRELARMLQDEEKAKVRRARERAKQRALLKKQKQLEEQQQQQQLPDTDERVSMSSTLSNSEGPSEYLSELVKRNSEGRGSRNSSLEDTSPQHLSNVAMIIDPTYKRSTSLPATSTPTTSLPTTPPSHLQASNTIEEDNFYDDDGPVPPYMPIQGQRRTASLEKKKKRREREACRQQ